MPPISPTAPGHEDHLDPLNLSNTAALTKYIERAMTSTNTASTINFNQTANESTKSNIFAIPQLTQNQKQQQFKESFELAGGAEAWVARIERECIEGSAISPALVKLNTQFIEDTGRWEINDRLGQDISRWYEGNLETGEWNRHRNHNYLAAAFFTSGQGSKEGNRRLAIVVR
jgi:hypothetical protein